MIRPDADKMTVEKLKKELENLPDHFFVYINGSDLDSVKVDNQNTCVDLETIYIETGHRYLAD